MLHPDLPGGPLRSLLMQQHVRFHQAGYQKLRAPVTSRSRTARGGARVVAVVAQGARLLGSRDERPNVPATAREDAPAEDHSLRAQVVLADPRLARVHRQFLAPGDEDALLRAGEATIRRTIQQMRRGAHAGGARG